MENKEYLTFDEEGLKHLTQKIVGAIPSNVSELSNDSNYITEKIVDDKILNSFYPAELQQSTQIEVGGFKPGDSLSGMTLAQILEKLLCGSTEFRYPTFLGVMDYVDIDSITYEALTQEENIEKNIVVKPTTTYVHNKGTMFNKTHVIAFPAEVGRIMEVIDSSGIALNGAYHWKTINFTVAETREIVPYLVGCNKKPLMFSNGTTVKWYIR